MHMHMHIHTHTNLHAHAHARAHAGAHAGAHADAHARTYAYIHTHTYIRIHTYMHACMHAYIHTYIHSNSQTHTGPTSKPSYVAYLRTCLPLANYLTAHFFVDFFTCNCVHCILRTLAGVRHGAVLRSVCGCLAEFARMYTHMLATDT